MPISGSKKYSKLDEDMDGLAEGRKLGLLFCDIIYLTAQNYFERFLNQPVPVLIPIILKKKRIAKESRLFVKDI